MVIHIGVGLTCDIFLHTPKSWLSLAGATAIDRNTSVRAPPHSGCLIWILHDLVDRLAVAGERLVKRAFVDEVGLATDGLFIG